MDRILIAIVVAVFAVGSASASDKTDVMATIHQWVDGFNSGDTKASLAACADQTSIIDDVPPHEWHGPGACAKWMNDYEASVKKDEITDAHFTVAKPRHLDITADHAYVVASANYTYKEKGKPMSEMGSIVTMSLQKIQAGWRITGWAWAQP
jgi:ketosteroid isomerase-like protein